MNEKEKTIPPEDKCYRLELPRTNIPTHKELAKWIAEGKGELLDINNFNQVLHSFDYALGQDNKPLHPLELAYYRIRMYGEDVWQKPDVKYMNIQRWDFKEFYVYIARRFGVQTITLKPEVLMTVIYAGGIPIASQLGAKTKIEGADGVVTTANEIVEWEKLTDEQVMVIEKSLATIFTPSKEKYDVP